MKRLYAIAMTLMISLSLLLPTIVSAKTTTQKINSALNQAGITGFGQNLGDANRIGLGGLVGRYVTVFLGFVGTIAFVIFLYGGFLWMTARGNEDQVAQAKQYLFNGTIGVVVIVLAYSAAYFITSQLYQAAR